MSASGANTRLALEAESTYGTEPSGNWSIFPFNSHTLGLTKAVNESAIITGDRNVKNVKLGAHQVAGDITFDLSNQAIYSEVFRALLGSTTITNGQSGVGTERISFSGQTEFLDLTGINDVHIYNGLEMNSLGLSIPATGICTGTLGVVGQTMDTEATSVGGTLVAADDTNLPFDASEVTITEGAADSIVTELSLNIDNGLSNQNVVGSVLAAQGAGGKCRVTGSMTALFESGTLLEKFIANTESALTLEFGSGADGFRFVMPRIVFTAGASPVEGDGLISLSMEFQALANGNASSITFDDDLTA